MKVIEFLAKHWICTLILVTIVFAVVLPNLADWIQSGVATRIQEVFS